MNMDLGHRKGVENLHVNNNFLHKECSGMLISLKDSFSGPQPMHVQEKSLAGPELLPEAGDKFRLAQRTNEQKENRNFDKN